MKLYTGKGDDGRTELFGGARIDKSALRVDVIGLVDELNAHLGLAAAACGDDPLRSILSQVQNHLFELGTDLAAPERQPGITDQFVRDLEGQIDTVCELLPPLQNFVLPGGSELAARLHVARTICRNAERRWAKPRKKASRGR